MLLPLLLGLFGWIFADLGGVLFLSGIDQNAFLAPIRDLVNQILASIPVLF